MAVRYDPAARAFVDDSLMAQGGMQPPPAPQESGLLKRFVEDPARALFKGAVVEVPRAAVGIANFATGGLFEKPLGQAGDLLERVGKTIEKGYSAQHQRQAQEVAETKGFFPTLGAYLSRPGYLVDKAVEMLPGMFAGGAAGRAIAGAANATRGAAIGEGLVAGGHSVEQIRQGAGGETTFGQRALGAAAGAVTGGIAFGAGKLANKLGVADADVLLAGGTRPAAAVVDGALRRGPGLVSRAGRGFATEGAEEMAQSAQEQVLQNAALGRDLGQGVAESAAAGLALGGVMGGTVSAAFHNNRLADGVAAIQVLSQPPQLDERGQLQNPKLYDDALRALVVLHPPGTDTRQNMNQWRLEQLDRITRGEGVDWSQFGAIATNQQLTQLASDTVQGIESRQAAAEAYRRQLTDSRNLEMRPVTTDDFGNVVTQEGTLGMAPAGPRPAAPSSQELARAAQVREALASGNTEALARQFGRIVRPDMDLGAQVPPATDTPPPATEPAAEVPAAPKPPKAPSPTDPRGWDDAALATAVQNIGTYPAKTQRTIREEQAKRTEATATYAPSTPIPSGDVLKAGLRATTYEDGGAQKPFRAQEVNKVADAVAEAFPNGGTVADMVAFLNRYAADHNVEYPKRAELAGLYATRLQSRMEPGAQNAQDQTNRAGAGPGPAAGQADAAVPAAAAGPAAQGNAPAQPTQEAPQAGQTEGVAAALDAAQSVEDIRRVVRDTEAGALARAVAARPDLLGTLQAGMSQPAWEMLRDDVAAAQPTQETPQAGQTEGVAAALDAAQSVEDIRRVVRDTEAGALARAVAARPDLLGTLQAGMSQPAWEMLRDDVAPAQPTQEAPQAGQTEGVARAAQPEKVAGEKGKTRRKKGTQAAVAPNEALSAMFRDGAMSLVAQVEAAAAPAAPASEAPGRRERLTAEQRAADAAIERDMDAKLQEARKEPVAAAWDRIRGDRATPGPRYVPTWAEAKAFVQSVLDAAPKVQEWAAALAEVQKELSASEKRMRGIRPRLAKAQAGVAAAKSALAAAQENLKRATPQERAERAREVEKRDSELARVENAMAYSNIETEAAAEAKLAEGLVERAEALRRDIDSLKQDIVRARAMTDLMAQFEIDRANPSFQYGQLLTGVAEARQAPWRAERERISKAAAKAAQDRAAREANKERLLDLADKHERDDGLSKADRAEFMERYDRHFKNNAKAKNFDQAMAQVVESILWAETAFGGTQGAMQAALEGLSGTQGVPALLDAVEQLATRPVHKALARLLRKLDLSGVRVVYKNQLMVGTTSTGQQGWKRGSFEQGTNTVTIYAGGENPQIILHELVHAATVVKMRAVMAKTGRAQTQADVQAQRGLRELTELYEYLKALPETKGEYAFKNLFEFVAEVHTNPAFQEKLKALKAPAGMFGQSASVLQRIGSVFRQYVDAVRKLLGMPPSATDALTRALETTAPFFAANTKLAAPAAAVETEDAMVSPIAAAVKPFETAKKYLAALDTATTKGFWSNTKAKARQGLLWVMSSEAIYHNLRYDPKLTQIREPFLKYFDADRTKSAVRKTISDLAYDGFAREVQLALAKTKNFERYNDTMGWLAGETSRLGIDLGKDFAGNKAAMGKALDDVHKDHVDRLHREYLRLKQVNNGDLARLLKRGELVNRQLYTMQMAALVRGVLRAHQKAGGATAAADDVVKRFWNRLDLLQADLPLKPADSAVHASGLSAELHGAITEMFKYVADTYPLTDISEDLRTIKQAYEKGWANPYMHLGRHGMYRVAFSVADASPQTVAKLEKLLDKYGVAVGPFMKGQDKVFMRVDSAFAAEEVRQLLLAQPGLLKKDPKGVPMVAAGKISDVAALENAFGTGKMLKELRSRLESRFSEMKNHKSPQMKAAYDAVLASLTDAMLDMLEVNSARQANQKREGVPGYSKNYMQNFAKRAQWHEASIANTYTSDLFTDAFREMQTAVDERQKVSAFEAERGQLVHDELATRFSNALKPVDAPFIHALSVFGNNFYLALSPAYAIGNLMQPYMLTLPYLGGRYGFVKAAKTMARSSRDTAKIMSQAIAQGWGEGGWRGVLDAKIDPKGTGLTKQEVDFVTHLLRSGVVDATQAHELGRMAEGDVSSGATAAKAVSLFNHYTEVGNRLSAGLAAYRMASDRAEDARRQYAIETVGATQFNYTDNNTARAIGRHGFVGAATPLFMQFQRFAFFMMEQYARLTNEAFLNANVPPAERKAARRALGGTLAAAAVVGGTLGLPFVTALVALANAFRGDDDDRDLRAMYRDWLADTFGKDLGEIVAKGALPRGVLGIELTGMLGQQNLLPGSAFAADRRNWEDKMKDQSRTMLGPALNAGFDIYGGLLHIKDGNLLEGVKAVLPRALKGPTEAVRTADAGAFVNKAGQPLPMPVEWADYAKMALGFTPAKKAEQSEANFYYQSELTQRKQDKAKATKQIVKSFDHGDLEGAMERLFEYQQRNPDNPIQNLGAMQAARARGRAMAELGPGILESNKNNLPLLQNYLWANTR